MSDCSVPSGAVMTSMVREILFQVENSRQRGRSASRADPVFQRAREDLQCLKSHMSIIACQGNFPLLWLLLPLPWAACCVAGASTVLLPPHLEVKSQGPVFCWWGGSTGPGVKETPASALSCLSCAIFLKPLTHSGHLQLIPLSLEALTCSQWFILCSSCHRFEPSSP